MGKKERPPRILPKKDREGPTLDEMEAAEHDDWVGDLERLEWKKSKDYAEREELLRKYKERGGK